MKISKKLGLGWALAFASIGVVAATSAVVVSCSSTEESPEKLTINATNAKVGNDITLTTTIPSGYYGDGFTYEWTVPSEKYTSIDNATPISGKATTANLKLIIKGVKADLNNQTVSLVIKNSDKIGVSAALSAL